MRISDPAVGGIIGSRINKKMLKKKTQQSKNNGIEIAAQDTLPRFLVRNARKYQDTRIALREKEFGIWQSFTWKDYLDHVRWFCLGLISMGLEADDKIAIVGDNRPEWVFAELAAQSAGAVPLGIYQDSTPKEVGYVIDHSDAKFVVAEDQ